MGKSGNPPPPSTTPAHHILEVTTGVEGLLESPAPPFVTDFVHQCLWRKVKVAECLSSWTRVSYCLVCGVLESFDHALYHCNFHLLIFDTLDKCWHPVDKGSSTYLVRTLPLHLSFS